MSEYPEPMRKIEETLKLYGGWSKIFRISQEKYEKEYIIGKESDGKSFWMLYAQALADKQFEETIEECIKEFREMFPEKKIPKKELRIRLATELLKNGWKPVKSRILKEIRDLRRQKREEIARIRKSLGVSAEKQRKRNKPKRAKCSKRRTS